MPSAVIPRSLQVLYGPAGERSLPERTLDHLPGYEGSVPVRVGNAAAGQFQLDVYGEVLDTMHAGRRASLPYDEHFWDLEQALLEVVESAWRRPDAGIWEIRGPEQHFTYSKVMAWVALDRAVRAIERHGWEGPVDRWRATRDEIHAEVCREGFDADRNTFVQHYGAKVVDAALLRLPLVGFIAPDDPRVAGTIAAVEHDLVVDGGYVLRYLTDHAGNVDALPPGEGCFLPCTLWLADAYALVGRHEDAGTLARPGAGRGQRRRPAGRGVRPRRRPVARQLPAGLLPRRGGEHRSATERRAGAATQLSRAAQAIARSSSTSSAGRLLAIMWFVAISW